MYSLEEPIFWFPQKIIDLERYRIEGTKFLNFSWLEVHSLKFCFVFPNFWSNLYSELQGMKSWNLCLFNTLFFLCHTYQLSFSAWLANISNSSKLFFYLFQRIFKNMFFIETVKKRKKKERCWLPEKSEWTVRYDNQLAPLWKNWRPGGLSWSDARHLNSGNWISRNLVSFFF